MPTVTTDNNSRSHLRRALTRRKNIVTGKFSSAAFKAFEKMSWHIVPARFDNPVPELGSLPDSLWDVPSELVGVDMNDAAQRKLLNILKDTYSNEYNSFPRDATGAPSDYYVFNDQYESVDGEILYSLVRYYKPRRIIEIGSGNSTLVTAKALRANKKEDKGYKSTLTAIEPYPSTLLQQGFPGFDELVQEKVENLPLSYFDQLKAGDILIIDSSHVAKIGSDVVYEYLEILPRLNKGVIIHIHDIFLPCEVDKGWITRERRFWNEQYLVHALLIFSSAFKVLWAGHYMHVKHPGLLKGAFESYSDPRTRWPLSFWIRKIK